MSTPHAGRPPDNVPHEFIKILRGMGYAFTRRDNMVDAVYLPALNQVWTASGRNAQARTVLRAHEYRHIYTCQLQPAMLAPLRNRLAGRIEQSATASYADLVETVAAMRCLPGREQCQSRTFVDSSERQIGVLARRCLNKAESTALVAHAASGDPTSDAVRAMQLALMHVIPTAPGTAERVIGVLCRAKVLPGWKGAWQLLQQLWCALADARARSKAAESSYGLAPPLEGHRTVGEMLRCLSYALSAARAHPQHLVGAIPALLSVLSMSSFIVVPLVDLRTCDGSFRGIITVVHSTRHSEIHLRPTITQASQLIARQRGAARRCHATELFLELIECSRPFRRSNHRGRIAGAIAELTSRIHRWCTELTHTACDCPDCAILLSIDAVRHALSHIAARSHEEHAGLMAVAAHYESWLRHQCLSELLGHAAAGEVCAVPAYTFL